MFQTAFKTIKSHSGSLTNSLSIIIVAVSEVLIGINVFQCPCETDNLNALFKPHDPKLVASQERKYYAIAFIVWPTVAAFFMSLAISGNVLRCLIEHRYTNCNLRRHCRALRFLMSNAKSVFVPPLAWIIIAFMDGRYYTCCVSKLPDNCLPDVKTLNTTVAANRATLERENLWHRATSQVIALTFVGVGLTLAGLFVICGQFLSKLPYYQRRYMQIYRDKEIETFTAVSEATLSKELTAKWELFFENAHKADWEAIADLPIGQPKELKGRSFYSDFHLWTSDKPESSTAEHCPPVSAENVSEMQAGLLSSKKLSEFVELIKNESRLGGLPVYSRLQRTLPNMFNNDNLELSASYTATKSTQTKDRNFQKKSAKKKVEFCNNMSYSSDMDYHYSNVKKSPAHDEFCTEGGEKDRNKSSDSLPIIDATDM